MSHSLTSHEDLTPYIEELLRVSNQTQSGLERRRSFAADPETIIKELLTELMNCRKNAQKVETIAKKFLEAYNTSLEDQGRLHAKIKTQGEDIGELNTLIQKYQKELEIKENRFESLTHEATDMERALKIINSECSQLKKERDSLKKELQNKEQMILARETAIQQRKNFMVEVEKEKEKDKEKETDKTLQKQYDQLVLNHKKSLTEIEDLQSRIYEIEALCALDKKEYEKMRNSVKGLRDELFSKKIEYEELLQKYRESKDRAIHLKEELLMEKAQNESLMKEYDRQKSTSFKNEFEIMELQDSLRHESFRRSRTEILSDFLGELEDDHKNESGFFAINSTQAASPKFVLINTKKTETLKPIFILPQLNVISLVRNTPVCIFSNTESQQPANVPDAPVLGFSKQHSIEILAFMDSKKQSVQQTVRKNNPMPSVERGAGVSVMASALHSQSPHPKQAKLLETQTSCKSQIFSKPSTPSAPTIPTELSLCKFTSVTISRHTCLKILKQEEISITKVPQFTFDDAASEESIETVASRTRKMSVIETRDPIKEFFIFVRHK